MNGRDRRYGRGRKASLKAKVGIVTAILVGGGAIGVAAVAATNHSPSTAESASYSTSTTPSPATLANQALVSNSVSATDGLLTKLASVKDFAEFKVAGKVVAIQRGIVVLVTQKFAIVESKDGQLHLWWLSAGTQFSNVAKSSAGTAALTASKLAASAAGAGKLAPAINAVTTGSIAAGLLTPASTVKTLTVTDAATGTTVTVLVKKTTALVITKTSKTTSKILESAFTSVKSLKRGDLTLIVGLHVNGALHAQKVLFVPLSASTLKAAFSSK
jgi:hypothetical protein